MAIYKDENGTWNLPDGWTVVETLPDIPGGSQNRIVYRDERGNVFSEWDDENGYHHSLYRDPATGMFVPYGPGTDHPDVEPMAHIGQGQSNPPVIDAQEIPSDDRYDRIEAPALVDAREVPSDDRYDRMEAPIINELEEQPPDPIMAAEGDEASPYGEVRGIPDWNNVPDLVDETATGQAPPTEDLEKERAEEIERAERSENPTPPEAPPPATPSEPTDPNVDRMPEEDSNPYGDVREAPDWNNIPDLVEEPAPAPPGPDPGPMLDPALLDATAPGPTLDPALFDPAVPGPTLDPALFDLAAPGPTLDPALLDPAASGATIDPNLLDANAPGETIDPMLLDPASPGPTLDPSLLRQGVLEPSSAATPAADAAGPVFEDPRVAELQATDPGAQNGGFEHF